MTTVIDVDVDAMINPHFNNVLFSKASNKVLEGGRGSTKSSAISLDIVYKFLQDPNANALVMRKVANTINMSVYEQIKWAIYMLRVNNQFEFKKSPYKIIHKATGTAIYFSGVDDPQKLKSFMIAKGYVRWLWFEELAEFNSWEEVDTVRASFTRKQLPNDLKVETYYSYNPPKNPYDWINEFVESRRNMPDWYVDHSTYKDVTLPNILAKSYLEEIETVRQNDPDYYRWMYLGEVVGLGTNVYNIDLFHVIDEFPSDDRLLGLYYSVDTGHETSATTCGCYGLTAKGNVILLDNYYYSPAGKAYKKSPTQLAEDLKAFIDRNGREYGMTPMRLTMDSAEGALDNEFYAKYAIHWHKVNKLKKVDMVDRVQDLLAHGRFFMLKKEANKIFYEENKRYQWDEKTLQSDDPKVIKENDHCADQFQYFVRDAERDLGLKW